MAGHSAAVACAGDGVYVMFVNRGPAIVVNVSQQEMTALLTHAAVAAPVAACRAQRVQEKLDVAWHGFDVVCADRYSVVVPGDDGKLGVRFAGALQSVSYMQVGERWHIERVGKTVLWP